MKGGPTLACLAGAFLLASLACRPQGVTSPDQLRRQIQELQKERDALRQRLDGLMAGDPRLEGMPATAIRVGVPTSLVRELAEKLVAGFVDQITLELRDLLVRKRGSVRKLVTLGEYDLSVRIDEVRGRLKTGRPELGFGGNTVSLSLPVTVASGSGRATLSFKWDGRTVGGAVCRDMEITREVSGSLKPDTYVLTGAIVLQATAHEILAAPRIPRHKINLKVQPSPASWAAVQQVLDEQRGVCGFVLDKIDVLEVVRGIVDKGFDVRLPTEKLKPVAVPVAVAPSLEVRGRHVELGVRLGRLAVTESTFWLGADVSVSPASAPR